MLSIPEGWMNPGGNSPARQFVPRTSMPMVCGVLRARLTRFHDVAIKGRVLARKKHNVAPDVARKIKA